MSDETKQTPDSLYALYVEETVRIRKTLENLVIHLVGGIIFLGVCIGVHAVVTLLGVCK